MNRVWIDPPYGWQYGFPKLYDKKVPLQQWLIDNGYPEHDTDFAMQYIRTWPEAQDETVVR
jgi:hypothetical protein